MNIQIGKTLIGFIYFIDGEVYNTHLLELIEFNKLFNDISEIDVGFCREFPCSYLSISEDVFERNYKNKIKHVLICQEDIDRVMVFMEENFTIGDALDLYVKNKDITFDLFFENPKILEKNMKTFKNIVLFKILEEKV